MSDKKTPVNAPAAVSDQEFDRFLRGEETATAATYRKLPAAEPDAGLDARVRALALRALRDSPPVAAHTGSSDDGTGGGANSRRARAGVVRARGARWVPAFASAAVLVLAAGIVWQLGPRNWARKEATGDIALDATTATNASPSARETKPDRVASVASKTPQSDGNGAPAAAKSTGAVQPNATDGANNPQAFPAQTSAPESAKSGGAGRAAAGATPAASPREKLSDADSPQADSPKGEASRDAIALAERPRAPEPLAPAREKRADAASSTELEKASSLAPQPSTPSASPPSPSVARTADDRVANRAALRSPAPVVAPRIAPVPLAPAPVVSEEAIPMPDQAVAQTATPAGVASMASPPLSGQASTRSLAAEASPADVRPQNEGAPQQAAQGGPASAEGPTIGSKKARSASALAATPPPPAPPPPPPMQAPAPPGAFAPEPSVSSNTAASKARASPSAAANGEDERKPAHADHFAPAADVPSVKIAGRPTAAQLAAWPAPNCHAAGNVISSGAGIDTRAWSYPPEVPDSAQLRLVIVKNYLEAGSPEGALKAYGDFHHCYPDDRWPASLLRRLGTQ